MNGNDFVLDTNIILYILSGDEVLAELLYNKRLYTSVVNEMELLSFSRISQDEHKQIKKFLSNFVIIELGDKVKSQAIETRKKSMLKLPDSIVAATAILLKFPPISSDKQFKSVGQLDFIFYQK